VVALPLFFITADTILKSLIYAIFHFDLGPLLPHKIGVWSEKMEFLDSI